jgi:hypothetical protein
MIVNEKDFMKKKYLAFIGISFILLTSFGQSIPKRKMHRDYVPDAETAIRVAEAIWLPIYGKGIFENKPFVAKLKDSTIWIVEGTLKDNLLGGVPYIEIQKSDCRILKVTHGK